MMTWRTVKSPRFPDTKGTWWRVARNGIVKKCMCNNTRGRGRKAL